MRSTSVAPCQSRSHRRAAAAQEPCIAGALELAGRPPATRQPRGAQCWQPAGCSRAGCSQRGCAQLQPAWLAPRLGCSGPSRCKPPNPECSHQTTAQCHDSTTTAHCCSKAATPHCYGTRRARFPSAPSPLLSSGQARLAGGLRSTLASSAASEQRRQRLLHGHPATLALLFFGDGQQWLALRTAKTPGIRCWPRRAPPPTGGGGARCHGSRALRRAGPQQQYRGGQHELPPQFPESQAR
jgi:hypothetical protein